MYKYAIIIISLFASSTLYGQSIDSDKSMVSFEIGNMKVRTVEGSFSNMKGSIRFNPDDPGNASFEVCIDASTIQTGNKKRDKHLREEDFFDVGRYPDICFTSRSTLESDGEYIAQGELTMNGVTKTVQIPFEFSEDTFSGTLSLNRLDYNIGEKTGTFMVSNEVSINIVCQLR
jgi:polyisoprenoid-binding protein YceI